MKSRKLTPDQIEWVCNQYRNGFRLKEIGDELNRTQQNIQQYLKAAGVERRSNRESHRWYSLNHSYFNNIDREDKAYWLGFLAADGSIQPKRSGIFLNLSPKDNEHLEKFKTDIGSDFPLYHYTSNGYSLVRLTFISPELVSALLKLGLDSNKTSSLTWPGLQSNLLRHFLRGYFDGDGSFVLNDCRRGRIDGTRARHICFRMIGPQQFIYDMQDYLVLNCDVKRNVTLTPNPKVPVKKLAYHGNGQVIRIANFLYEDATVYLDRKRDIVLNHYRSLPQYCDQLRFG